MKCERLFLIIFLASVVLFTIFGLETKGGSGRTELEKRGYTYSESSYVECAKKGVLTRSSCFWPKESTSTP